MINGILIDYGGTIDTNGIHWGEVIWNMYQQNHVPIDKKNFKLAYSHGERMLAIEKHVFPEHDFLDTLKIKTAIQFRYLTDSGLLAADTDYAALIDAVAESCNAFAQKSIDNARPVLDLLKAKYSMVLVSNFYGNIETVLQTFGIRHYFKEVIESAVVGVRKPDSRIFMLGASALRLPAETCVVIGDSYTKDIAPGAAAGCKTIWLKSTGWGDDPADVSLADRVMNDFGELPAVLATL